MDKEKMEMARIAVVVICLTVLTIAIKIATNTP